MSKGESDEIHAKRSMRFEAISTTSGRFAEISGIVFFYI